MIAMFTALTHGWSIYLRAWATAFGRRGRHLAPLRPRRLAVLLLGFPLFMLLQLAHALGHVLDELLFRGWRRVRIEAPLFISGIPRSGTTFVHRVLAADESRYSSLRTWEAVLAPSVTQRCLWRGLARADRLIGSPLRRTLLALTRRLGDFQDVHEVGLWQAEEDYLALLPAAGCFVMVLAFPHCAALWQLGRLERMPARRRQALLDHYEACLKKHLYAAGGGRPLLSKNAAFASWLPALRERFPDARFLICVREPLTALSSQLSAISAGRELFASDPDGRHFTQAFRQLFGHNYASLLQQLQAAPARTAVLDQGELSRCPQAVLVAALQAIGIEAGPRCLDALARSGGGGGAHRHRPDDFGLTAETADGELGNTYRRIRQLAAGSSRLTTTGS